MSAMTIGRLARDAGVSIDTVRFYERRGLIAEPTRTLSNYRIYSADDVVLLRFIKKSKELGFSLSEIKDLLALRHDPSASKADVKQRTEGKIKNVRRKIEDLTHILAALEHLSASCDGQGPISDCPILDALQEQVS